MHVGGVTGSKAKEISPCFQVTGDIFSQHDPVLLVVYVKHRDAVERKDGNPH